jgi:hypothetical protein
MSTEIPSDIRAAWQVPEFDTPLWLGRRHPWCVVIPVVNEGDRIARLLGRMAGLDVAGRADIVIVDGGSSDGSLELESLRAKGVSGLLVKTGPGKLSAQLRCAYAFALDQGYEGIVTIDGNDKDDPEAIPRFLDALEAGTDFVQASRFIPGGLAEGTPRSRDLAIRWLHAPVLRWASGFAWTDTTQGFRAYSRRLLLDPELAPFRHEFLTYELLAYLSYRAPRLGYRCLELPSTRRYPPGEVRTKISGIRGNLVLVMILFKAALGLLNPTEPAPGASLPVTRSAAAIVAVLVASAVAAAAAVALAVRLEAGLKYPDFIAGALTLKAGTKLRDLIAGPLFVAVGLGAFWFLFRLMARMENRLGRDHAGEFAAQLIWWSIPAITAGAGLIVGSLIDMKVLVVAAAGLAAMTLACAFATRARVPLRPSQVGLSMLAGVLIALLPVELAVLLGRGTQRSPQTAALVDASIPAIGAGLAAMGLAVILLPERLMRWLPGLLALGQIGLPVFYLTLLPSQFATAGGQITGYRTTRWLAVLAVGLMVLGILDVVRRFWRGRKAGGAVALLLSPVALFALVVGIRLGATIVPHVPVDDYHFGELLLGWSTYGPETLPYVDYMPAHGLAADGLPGLISTVFYDGTAATIAESGRIAFILLALAAFVSLWLFTGSPGLAFVSTLFVGTPLSWLFLVPFICLWLSPALRREPARWLAIWGLTGPLVILGVPPQGLVLVAASGVIAVRAAWDLWRDPDRRRWREVAGAVLVLGAALVLTPLLPILAGAVRYVVENGPINQIAYGLPWGVSWEQGVAAGLVMETVRMSWLAIPATGIVVIYLAYKRRLEGAAAPALAIVLFGLLMVPYAMGRIDLSTSRADFTAVFGWTILVPVVAWRVLRPAHRAPLLLVVAAMAATFNFTAVSFAAFNAAAAPVLPVGQLRDGAAAGMPRLGHALVDEEHWDRLVRLESLMSASLKPEETYLDLTNRNAHYFYLDRRPPIPVAAPYNLVPVPQQRRAVERLSGNPPPLALLEAVNIVHDGVAHALRVPLLYRFVLDTYTPTWEDGFIVGHRKQPGDQAPVRPVRVPVQGLSDARPELGLSQEEPAILVDDDFPIEALPAGSRVLLGDGVERRITRVDPEPRAIWVDGGDVDASLLGSLSHIELAPAPGSETHQLRMTLLERAFAPLDLFRLPVSWGRSEGTLASRMELVRRLEPAGSGMPRASFDLSRQPLAGRRAGLLRFTLECPGPTEDPRVVVTWTGEMVGGFAAGGELRFTADDGPLIVPLSAYPRWATLDRATGMTIALENPAACPSMAIRDAGLYQAEMFRGLD